MGRAEFRDAIHRVQGAPRPLDRLLREAYPHASWNDLRRLITSGKVFVNDDPVRDVAARVGQGDTIAVRMAARRPRGDDEKLANIALVYVDRDVVVVDKPSGISSVAYAEERDSADLLVRRVLRRNGHGGPDGPLGVVHRLDKETSGLIVYARTLAAKRALKQEFRTRQVERRYYALAHGRVRSGTLSSRLVADRGDGLRGSTDRPELGKLATTHVRVIAATDAASFIECRLESGRTHQIRIHLFEAGHPLLGERVYVRRLHAPPPPASLVSAPRVMLHAATLGFRHPTSARHLSFESGLPEDMRALRESLSLNQ